MIAAGIAFTVVMLAGILMSHPWKGRRPHARTMREVWSYAWRKLARDLVTALLSFGLLTAGLAGGHALAALFSCGSVWGCQDGVSQVTYTAVPPGTHNHIFHLSK